MTVESLITQHIDTWTSTVKTKSTSGRGSSKKLELYGVKKLRELILELAVRGKLVPQDPNDEPASVQLAAIKKEQLKLIKEKKIKKPKPLPSIDSLDKPFSLPVGWDWELFGNVCHIERGGSPRPIKSFITDNPNGLNWIKIGDTDIGGKYITSTEEKIRPEGLSKTRQVFPGDFLLTNSMSFGRPYITKIEGCIHDGWLRISPPSTLDKDYLYSLLSSPFIVRSFKKSAAGAVVMNLNADKVRETIVAIPPNEEQHHIVAKVDELMTLCDQLEQQTEASIEAHQLLVSTLLNTLTNSADADELMENWKRISNHFDTLFTTEASIDQLKQTILQLAVMGKLVPQDPNDEPASVLLERIAEEKTQLIKDKKIKKQKALPPIADDEKPFELPKGWEWIRLGALTSLVTSGSRGWNKYYSDSGATFIRSQDIKYDRVEFDNRAFVELPQSTEGKRTKVDLGDILVTITGANVGKAAVVEQELPEAYVSQHVSLIKLMDQRLSPYIHLWLTGSHGGRLHLLSQSYGDKPGLNLQNINELVVPVAPEEHQLLVLTKVDQLMELCERLKQRLCDSQQTQLKLTDAIVEQAL
ncbi:restriction endonuclease [Photobacterium phosphoreum]|uniref:restriction endonuclease subunit S n=1 Tax=Photobacterium phosphoreum TaxID=659 RepID=UPI0007F94D16|nr:restriction endonuclease subunit S [Photobacterium phosphoreum]OBU40089.1 restriction endonuclease [Photobacterium phosphoreum]